jgi:hypothetical protein
VAPAQQGGRMRRIGVLMSTAADDPESPLRIAALAQGLFPLAVGGSSRCLFDLDLDQRICTFWPS